MNTFTGTVVKGKFTPDSPGTFKLAFCAHEGKRVTVSVDRFHQKRSNQQNKYWWAVPVALISDKTGFTPEQTHEAIVMELHYEIFNGKDGQALKVPLPTRNLTTSEFMELIDKVQRWAAEFFDGLYIPDPSSAGYDLKDLK